MRTQRWTLLAAIAAAACGGYSAPDEVVLGQAVYTQKAPTANFAPLRTYYLDPVMEHWEDGETVAPVVLPSSTAAVINARMVAYGYTAAPQASANVGLRLAWTEATQVAYYYNNWCSVYWAYYSCWPTWSYAGSYRTGTVLTAMVDLRTTPAHPNDSRNMLWVSAMYSVLQATSIENQTLLNEALDRAFDQSTYLKTSAVP